jgi:hypothetical protein
MWNIFRQNNSQDIGSAMNQEDKVLANRIRQWGNIPSQELTDQQILNGFEGTFTKSLASLSIAIDNLKTELKKAIFPKLWR